MIHPRTTVEKEQLMGKRCVFDAEYHRFVDDRQDTNDLMERSVKKANPKVEWLKHHWSKPLKGWIVGFSVCWNGHIQEWSDEPNEFVRSSVVRVVLVKTSVSGKALRVPAENIKYLIV